MLYLIYTFLSFHIIDSFLRYDWCTESCNWLAIVSRRLTTYHVTFCCSDLRRAQVQRMEKVNVWTTFNASIHVLSYSRPLLYLPDSDKEEGTYCPPVKRERTSSFPPPHSGKVTCWLSSPLLPLHPHACSVHSDWYSECNTHLLLLQFPRTMYSCPQVSASLRLATLTLSQVRSFRHYLALMTWRPHFKTYIISMSQHDWLSNCLK